MEQNVVGEDATNSDLPGYRAYPVCSSNTQLTFFLGFWVHRLGWGLEGMEKRRPLLIATSPATERIYAQTRSWPFLDLWIGLGGA